MTSHRAFDESEIVPHKWALRVFTIPSIIKGGMIHGISLWKHRWRVIKHHGNSMLLLALCKISQPLIAFHQTAIG